MKIYHKDSNLLILNIIHSNKNDIKKLSQKNRMICMAALKCLSSKEDNGINVNLPSQLSFEKAIIEIKNSLDSKTASKKILFIRIITSIAKGILNFLSLRTSSAQIWKNIDLIKNSFLKKNWDQYLNDYCDVRANCKLDEAKIIFMGDQHADHYQNILRQNLVTHYAVQDNNSENLVLIEGLDINDFPTHLDNKNIIVESWENKDHFTEQGILLEKQCKLLREMKILITGSKELIKNKNTPAKDKINHIFELKRKSEKIYIDYEKNNKELHRLTEIRNQDLIDKLKAKKSNQNQKIFVIAGSNHILTSDYNIIDHFKETPCAVFIPKESNLGKENARKVVQNIVDLGAYDAAYRNL